jgi:hypothetical protein
MAKRQRPVERLQYEPKSRAFTPCARLSSFVDSNDLGQKSSAIQLQNVELPVMRNRQRSRSVDLRDGFSFNRNNDE